MRQAVLLMASLATYKNGGDGMSARRIKDLLRDAERQRLIAMRVVLDR